MRLFEGAIISCDRDNNVYQYLIEDEGRIIYVGDKLPPTLSRRVQRIELGNKALLPAFGDGHIHYSNWALFNSTFDVRSAASLADIEPLVRRYARRDRSARVLFGFGHSKNALQERRLITRSELDQIIKDRPVYLVCYDGHSAVVNTAAIGLLPVEIRSLPGFDLENGHLTRAAFLAATDYITAKIPVTRLVKAIVKGFDALARYGVGLIHTVEGVGFTRDLDVDLVRFAARGAQQQFRVYFQTMDVDKVLKRRLPRIGGCFACALDGCFGAEDAALLEPYSNNSENRGILYYSDQAVADFVTRANRAGLQIQLHCIGDAAVTQAVDALEIALRDTPRQDHRHTLIHACLIPENYMEKIAALKIGVTLQPAFLTSPLEPLEYLTSILGERALKSSPLKAMKDLGIMVSGGSDSPVVSPDPLTGIDGACNHSNPEQSVSVAEALTMFSYNVAYTSFDERERGSLEKGKIADLVLLNQNPLELDRSDLKKLRVEELYLGGLPYQRGRKIKDIVINSIRNRKRQT